MRYSDRQRVWNSLSAEPKSVAVLAKNLRLTSDAVRTACSGLQRDGGAKAVGSRKPGKQLWVRVGDTYPVFKPVSAKAVDPEAMNDLGRAWGWWADPRSETQRKADLLLP